MHQRVAVLIDGGYVREQYKKLYGKLPADAAMFAKQVHDLAYSHAQKATVSCDLPNGDASLLYRIFYYDCPPLDLKVIHPITGLQVDYGKSGTSRYMNQFLKVLREKRKVALRMGRLATTGEWQIKTSLTRDILKGSVQGTTLAPKDIKYEVRQKGVDMKIGLDIASLAYKRLVGTIVLIAGDADFVPVAKLARLEGIDFILDPLWKSIPADLTEHIDGLRTLWARHTAPAAPAVQAAGAAPAPQAAPAVQATPATSTP